VSEEGGEGRNRTGDTTVFSRVLYQLSYLARRRSVAGSARAPDRAEPGYERLDELVLEEHGVGSGLARGTEEFGFTVAGDRDHADRRMIATQARDSGDAVDDRHVDVDHRRVRRELVRKLDRPQAVGRLPDDAQLRLPLNQFPQGMEIQRIVVGQ
jgi:hypothetical protein